MISWLIHFVVNFLKILKDRRTLQKISLISFWIKIKCKTLQNETNIQKEISFLNYEIHYVSARSLAYLVEEIFINHLYRFESSNTQPLIYDAGANIGMSLIYFKMYYPQCRIMAFEADKNTYNICSKNVSANNLSSIELMNIALWKENTTLKFYTNANVPAALNQGFFTHSESFVEIPTSRLSSYINMPIDFLKMDIEGAEKMVFEDLNKSNSLQYVEQMCIECHLIQGRTENLQYLLQLLENLQFAVKLGTHTLVNYDFYTPQDCMIYAKKS